MDRKIEELLSGNISRDEMTHNEEVVFVNYWFDKFEKAGFTGKFTTPYTDYQNYIGKQFEVLGRATEETVDLEALPMWKVRFEDGTETIAYPEEICNRRADDCPQSGYHPCSGNVMLESTEGGIPCTDCEKATTVDGICFGCPKRIAALLVADIRNGNCTDVAGTTDQDVSSRYLKFAHSETRSIVVKIILRVAAPGFNSEPYYELHFIDNITGRDGELIPVWEMTVESVAAELAAYIKRSAKYVYNAKQQANPPVKYLVQCKHPDGMTTTGLFTSQQIIDMHGYRDCSGCEYEVYNVQAFGKVIKLEERCDSHDEPNYHRLCYPKHLGGDTVFSGFSPEH